MSGPRRVAGTTVTENPSLTKSLCSYMPSPSGSDQAETNTQSLCAGLAVPAFAADGAAPAPAVKIHGPNGFIPNQEPAGFKLRRLVQSDHALAYEDEPADGAGCARCPDRPGSAGRS